MRTAYWAEYLDRRGMKEYEAAGNCIKRSFRICTLC
jgi:hypothetical protein